MIKIKRKKLNEAEAIPTTAPTTPAFATTTEKSIDDAAKTSKLLKFSELSNTSQVINVLTQDFKLLTGDQRYISLAQFLSSIGISKQDVQATTNKMTEPTNK